MNVFVTKLLTTFVIGEVIFGHENHLHSKILRILCSCYVTFSLLLTWWQVLHYEANFIMFSSRLKNVCRIYSKAENITHNEKLCINLSWHPLFSSNSFIKQVGYSNFQVGLFWWGEAYMAL